MVNRRARQGCWSTGNGVPASPHLSWRCNGSQRLGRQSAVPSSTDPPNVKVRSLGLSSSVVGLLDARGWRSLIADSARGMASNADHAGQQTGGPKTISAIAKPSISCARSSTTMPTGNTSLETRYLLTQSADTGCDRRLDPQDTCRFVTPEDQDGAE
jgi:hypothetical protein